MGMIEPDDGFVTRRGKHVSSDDLNMSALSIDGTVEPTMDSVKTVRVIKPRRQWHIGPRWAAAGVLIVFVLPFAIGELLTWQYSHAIGTTRARLISIVSGDVTAAQDNTNLTADGLSQITSRMYSLSSQMCRGGLIDNMATLYPRANDARKRCVVAQQLYSSLAGSLRQYENEQRYLEQLNRVLKPVAAPTDEQFAIISSQLEMWKTIQAALGKLSPPDSLRSSHSVLIATVTDIAAQWSQLYVAYNDQDPTGFDTASNDLSKGYERLRSQADDISRRVTASQDVIIADYRNIK